MVYISNADYHKSEAYGSSDVRKWINGNPHKWLFRKEQTFNSDAMALGSLVHTIILEPERFTEEYAVSTFKDFRTKEAKEWKKAAKERGLIIIDTATANKAEKIKDSVMNHQGAAVIFKQKGRNEQSFFWTDSKTGLNLKYRPDRIVGSSIIDLKTSRDASPTGFLKSVEQYQYWIQAGFYFKGFAAQFGKLPKHFFIVAVETTSPYEVAVYELDSEDIDLGMSVVDKALKEIKEAQETGIYHGYNKGEKWTTLKINDWAKRKFMEVE